MQVPNGSERFTFPTPQAPSSPPNSPPSTPESASSFQTRPPNFTPLAVNKRHGIIGPILSPPEHLEPVNGHNFSYAPQQRASTSNTDSDDSDDESEVIETSNSESEEEHDEEVICAGLEAPEVPNRTIIVVSPVPPFRRRTSTAARSYDSSIDFTVEEITEDDIGYDSDTEVILPFQCEDPPSDTEHQPLPEQTSNIDSYVMDSDTDNSLIDDLENLHCHARDELREKERGFEAARHARKMRAKKRWSKGGNHKRFFTESLGSDSEDIEDITPLDDADVLGSSARRLRRRTEGPEARPRKSLLFEDPPKEVEELKYLAGDGEVIDTDDELMLPTWFAMQVDSESSNDEEATSSHVKTKQKTRRR